MLLTNALDNSGNLIDFLSHLSPGEATLLVVFLLLGGGNLGSSVLNAIRTKNTFAQTVPNHGSSLRDAVDRIETTIEDNSRRLEDLRNDLEHERKTTEQYRDQLEGRIVALELKRRR